MAIRKAIDAAKQGGALISFDPNIRLLNVTAGANGSYSYYEDKRVFVPACRLGGTIETTGAGDTFCAFVLEHGLDGLMEAGLRSMLSFANTAAYLVTTRKGAIRSMPERAEVVTELEWRLKLFADVSERLAYPAPAWTSTTACAPMPICGATSCD